METLTREQFLKVRYATRLWLLQERAHLTFMEARCYLREERNETVKSLAESFGVDEPTIEHTIEEAERKYEEASKLYEIFFGHGPVYPRKGEKIEL